MRKKIRVLKEEAKQIEWPSLPSALRKTATVFLFSGFMCLFIAASDEIGKMIVNIFV